MNGRRYHALFVLAHILFIAATLAYAWTCTEILRGGLG